MPKRRVKQRYLMLSPCYLLAAVFLFFFVLLLPVQTVFAHRMYMLEGENAGSLQVLYEGDIPARRAVVKLYDQTDQVIIEGNVDRDGFFYFTPSAEIQRATADDGLGHLAHLDYRTARPRQLPLALRVVLGLVILGAIGIFSKKLSRVQR